jgi:tripartite-type tricarboxylate transporter receptor subunit TctC
MGKGSILLIAGTAAVVAVLGFVADDRVAAQEAYPTRPVLLTHGFAAGGNGDVVSRIVGDALSPRLGQPVIIEPRPGAGGNTASARLAKAEPDGYTLITLTGGHAVSAAIYKTLQFDPLDDFQMVSVYGYQAFMVAVRKDSAIKTMADLIAAAKASPGKLTYSSVGVGSTQHLAGALLCAMAGIEMTHVPYRGGTAPMTDLLGGTIDLSVDTITVIEPQVRSGNVHALGVTSGTKWWSLPDITPIADTVAGYDVRTWLGMAAPKATPAPVVARLNAALRSGLADPPVEERLRKVGMDVRASSPEEMRAMVAAQIARWKQVVADAKIPQQ